jgi:hypothetical protein
VILTAEALDTYGDLFGTTGELGPVMITGQSERERQLSYDLDFSIPLKMYLYLTKLEI